MKIIIFKYHDENQLRYLIFNLIKCIKYKKNTNRLSKNEIH